MNSTVTADTTNFILKWKNTAMMRIKVLAAKF